MSSCYATFQDDGNTKREIIPKTQQPPPQYEIVPKPQPCVSTNNYLMNQQPLQSSTNTQYQHPITTDISTMLMQQQQQPSPIPPVGTIPLFQDNQTYHCVIALLTSAFFIIAATFLFDDIPHPIRRKRQLRITILMYFYSIQALIYIFHFCYARLISKYQSFYFLTPKGSQQLYPLPSLQSNQRIARFYQFLTLADIIIPTIIWCLAIINSSSLFSQYKTIAAYFIIGLFLSTIHLFVTYKITFGFTTRTKNWQIIHNSHQPHTSNNNPESNISSTDQTLFMNQSYTVPTSSSHYYNNDNNNSDHLQQYYPSAPYHSSFYKQ